MDSAVVLVQFCHSCHVLPILVRCGFPFNLTESSAILWTIPQVPDIRKGQVVDARLPRYCSAGHSKCNVHDRSVHAGLFRRSMRCLSISTQTSIFTLPRAANYNCRHIFHSNHLASVSIFRPDPHGQHLTTLASASSIPSTRHAAPSHRLRRATGWHVPFPPFPHFFFTSSPHPGRRAGCSACRAPPRCSCSITYQAINGTTFGPLRESTAPVLLVAKPRRPRSNSSPIGWLCGENGVMPEYPRVTDMP